MAKGGVDTIQCQAGKCSLRVAKPRAMAKEDIATCKVLLSLSTGEEDVVRNVNPALFMQFAQEFLAVDDPAAVPVTITGGQQVQVWVCPAAPLTPSSSWAKAHDLDVRGPIIVTGMPDSNFTISSYPTES